mmetsp:Transcript_55273/g.172711  ORF Transcript_55273/g.172711 Transcript_55273/m.172711 type:complete len:221 (+) Transcript_55273:1633-2295(+)
MGDTPVKVQNRLQRRPTWHWLLAAQTCESTGPGGSASCAGVLCPALESLQHSPAAEAQEFSEAGQRVGLHGGALQCRLVSSSGMTLALGLQGQCDREETAGTRAEAERGQELREFCLRQVLQRIERPDEVEAAPPAQGLAGSQIAEPQHVEGRNQRDAAQSWPVEDLRSIGAEVEPHDSGRKMLRQRAGAAGAAGAAAKVAGVRLLAGEGPPELLRRAGA